MAVYLFAYDLINEKSGFDYKPLWTELERLRAHRTQYSLWLLSTTSSAKEICDHFKSYVDKDDRLWAAKLSPNQYWYVNAIGGTNEWLKANPVT